MLKKIKLFVFSSLEKPVPDICGGAVETLLTNFILENEKKGFFKLLVVSKYVSPSDRKKYKNCKIIYVKAYKHSSFLKKTLFLIYKLFRKFLFNRFSYKIFKFNKRRCSKYDFSVFQSYLRFLLFKPDFFVSEGYDELHRLWPFVLKAKPERCVYHLHYARKENVALLNLFPNCIAISKFVLNGWAINSNGYCDVVFNGSPLSNSGSLLQLKKEPMFDKTDFVYIFAGRIVKSKGIIELIEAFNELNMPKSKLLILGDLYATFGEKTDIKQEFLNLVDSNPNIYYCGFVPNNRMNLYYSNSNVQVIPSLCQEGAGLVAVEGMRNNLPLIITNVGGLPEYVPEDACVKINISENLIDDLKYAMYFLYSNRKKCIEMGNNGKKFADNFTIEKYYNDIVNYYTHLIEKNENE